SHSESSPCGSVESLITALAGTPAATRRCNSGDQHSDFRLGRNPDTIAFFDEVDLHCHLSDLNLTLLNSISPASHPLEHGLEMPNHGAALVYGSGKSRRVGKHELAHILTCHPEKFRH